MNVFIPSGQNFKDRILAGMMLNARNNGVSVMSDDDIRAVAPSVFAESAHESRSDRYAYIPTVNVVRAMREEGFMPVAASQGKSRTEGKEAYTKHLVRFRRQVEIDRDSGEGVPEVVMINSHDGTSSYVLLSGLLRPVCKNGLIVADGSIEGVRIGHTGKVVEKVVQGSYKVIDSSNQSAQRAAQWAKIELAREERLAFARAAVALRFDTQKQQIAPESIIEIRREQDESNDLWTVFNRAQEGLIRGGQSYRSERGRNVSARPVRAIDSNVGLNQALWTLGEEMAKLKAA